jgi:hypothetical protein
MSDRRLCALRALCGVEQVCSGNSAMGGMISHDGFSVKSYPSPVPVDLCFFGGQQVSEYAVSQCFLLEVIYHVIRINGGGNANLLPVFFNPYDHSLTLKANRTVSIKVFQNNREGYGLTGRKRTVRLKEYPCAAQITGYPVATAFGYNGQRTPETRRFALFRFFQMIASWSSHRHIRPLRSLTQEPDGHVLSIFTLCGRGRVNQYMLPSTRCGVAGMISSGTFYAHPQDR